MKKCTGFNGAQCKSLRSRERRAAQCGNSVLKGTKSMRLKYPDSFA
ncbi:hypothetical protein T06_12284 [Trichinella sp. T6]|nr:hypothetical protein T06_12284 [Trichinella sp. T6]